MSSGNVPGITGEIILLRFSDKSIKLPIFGFIQIINKTICSLLHSLNMERPEATNDKHVEVHRFEIKQYFFVLQRFKSVSNLTIYPH